MMKMLEIDALTASVAAASLIPRGNGLKEFAQALDEDWKRYAVDPSTGTRHLISTMGNRQNCPPTGLPYYNTGLIQPDSLDAIHRPMDRRFLRGRPRFCAELQRKEDGYRLETALLEVSADIRATVDRKSGKITFHIQSIILPDTVMDAAIGHTLGEVLQLGLQHDLRVTGLRVSQQDEMRGIFDHNAIEGIAIETELPDWQSIEFQEVYFS